MDKQFFALIILLSVGFNIAYTQEVLQFEKITELAKGKNCAEAIALFNKTSPHLSSEEAGKKLEALLSITLNCKTKEFKSTAMSYLDSIILHPQSLKYPEITRSAFELKQAYVMFQKEKALECLLQLEAFETEAGTDSTRAVCQLKIGGIHFVNEQFNQSQNYYAKALQLTNSQNDSILAYVGLGNASKVNPVKADSFYQKALNICTQIDDSLRIASTLRVYGSFLSKTSKYQSAAEYLIASSEMYPKKKTFDLSRVIVNNEISQLFMDLNDLDRAEEYNQNSIRLCEKNKYRSRNGMTAVISGMIQKEKGNFDKAKEEFFKALSYFKKREKQNSILGVLGHLGSIAMSQNDMDAANKYYHEGKKVYDQIKNDSNKNLFLLFSGRRFKALKDYQKAEQAFQDLYNLGKERDRSEMCISALSQLSQLKQVAGDFEQSLDYYKSYKSLEDSIYRSDQNKLVFDIESKYNRAEQDKEIAVLDAKSIKAQSTLSKQNTIITIGALALFFISILSFFLFNLYKKVTLQKVQISKALNEKDTLLREIHHRVKNNLQLVSSLLSLQSRHVEDPNALEVLNSGKSRIRSMALIHQDLYNRENLTGVSVKEYLEKLCKELISTYQIDTERIKLETEIDDLQLDVDTLVPLGLIINELLTNALKYAFPNNKGGLINVNLSEIKGQLQLAIKDDGIGIDKTKKSDSSFGYKLINTLLHQLKGKLQQESNNGTQVFLTFDNYKIAA